MANSPRGLATRLPTAQVVSAASGPSIPRILPRPDVHLPAAQLPGFPRPSLWRLLLEVAGPRTPPADQPGPVPAPRAPLE